MRIGVTGGRAFGDVSMVVRALRGYPMDAVLVHGAATGADHLCQKWWMDVGREVEPHPAKWQRDGKFAGAIRNQEMVDSGLDVLIAFPGGRGTADMIARAQVADVPIVFAAEIGQPPTVALTADTTRG
jgi:SLOG family YspA-like protein